LSSEQINKKKTGDSFRTDKSDNVILTKVLSFTLNDKSLLYSFIDLDGGKISSGDNNLFDLTELPSLASKGENDGVKRELDNLFTQVFDKL
jgi:hypothetical protein